MRVSDSMMQGSYLNNISKAKQNLQKLQQQAITGKKVSNPSDSPSGTVSILSLSKRIETSQSYIKNIQNTMSYLNETEAHMDVLETEVSKVLNVMVQSKNSANSGNLANFGEQIDISLKAMIEAANADYDGKYIFGGTDFSAKPYDYTTDGSSIEVKTGSVAGEQNINIANNIQRKVNITGAELFGTLLKQDGKLDSSAANGTITTSQTTIKNGTGTDFTLKTSYEKTGANTYSFTYDIEDGTGTSIFSSAPAAKELIFDATSGKLKSLGGSTPLSISIKDATNKIDFQIEFSSIKEESGASGLNFSSNQEMDIFNRLIIIKEKLLAGIVPSDEDYDAVSTFHQHVLDKTSQVGNVMNQLQDTEDLLNNRILNLQELLSSEQNVDQEKVILDLQSQDYQLQIAYKLSSMILPKSLLDYL